jgi:hypothetical protein
MRFMPAYSFDRIVGIIVLPPLIKGFSIKQIMMPHSFIVVALLLC